MISYISAPCGAGKTRHIINKINNDKESTRYLLIQNTLDLIHETIGKITCTYKVITSEQYTNAFDTCVEYMLNNSHAKVTLITDKVFYRLPIAALKTFKIYIDDCVDFHQFDMISILNDENRLDVARKLFSVVDVSENKNYAELAINDVIDDLDGAINENTLKKFKNMDHIYGNKSFYEKCNIKKTRLLSLVGVIDIEKYKELDITFIANDFENSLMFKSNPLAFNKMEIDLLQRKIPIEQRVKVYYFIPGSTYNDTWRRLNRDDYKKIIQYLNDNVKDEYYWTKNSNDNVKLNGNFVKPQLRGVNSLQHYSTAVWLCSMKPSPQEISTMMDLYNISASDLIQAREQQTLHQFIQRGLIRNFDSNDIMTVYCMDEQQARTLASEPEFIDISLNYFDEKIEPLTPAQRRRINRFVNKKISLDVFRKWLFGYKNADLTDLQKQIELNKFMSLM